MREANERLLEKIRKMIAHERSARLIGSLDEAAAFAERIQQLLIEHKLSMAEVEASDVNLKDVIGEEIHYTTTARAVRPKKSDTLYLMLFSIVAKAHYCDSVSQHGFNLIYLIGREEDRAVALEMFSYLWATMKQLCSKERKVRKAARRSVRNFRSSFYRGFIGAIAYRYQQMNEKQEETAALILRRSLDEVQTKAAELHPNTFSKKSGKRVRKNSAAFRLGVILGHETSLATNVIREGQAAITQLTD